MSRSLVILLIILVVVIGGLFFFASRPVNKTPAPIEKAVSLDNLQG